MMKQGVYVIIPAFNEEQRIGDVVSKAKPYCQDVIVVDDGSLDKSFEAAERAGADCLKHIVNLGKGAATKTGCDYAFKQGAEIFVLMDGDGQHDASEIPRFLKALEKTDIVFGYRDLSHEMPGLFRLGNNFIQMMTGMMFGIRVNDPLSGFRAFKREAYQKIRWDSSDYFVETEMIARVGKNRLSFEQIPIKTIYKDKYKGTTFLDGIKIFLHMLWWKMTR